MTENNNGGIVMTAAHVERTKVLDRGTGIQTIKGGQTIDIGFIDAVVQSYANLVNSPMALLMLATLGIMALAEVNNSDGPLEVIASALHAFVEDTDNSPILLGLARFMIVIFDILIVYKVRLIAIGTMWVPYLAKPSSNNFKISLFLTIVLVFRKTDLSADIILSQLYFIYTQLRSPKARFIILVAALVLFVFGVAHITEAAKYKAPRPNYIAPKVGEFIAPNRGDDTSSPVSASASAHKGATTTPRVPVTTKKIVVPTTPPPPKKTAG